MVFKEILKFGLLTVGDFRFCPEPSCVRAVACIQAMGTTSTSTTGETFREAFTTAPGTNLAGIPTTNLKLSTPFVSYGLSYDKACARHVVDTFRAHRVYVVASGSMARNTDRVDRLVDAINGAGAGDGDGGVSGKGRVKVVGVRKGITPHTPWSEILQIACECRDVEADCVVTLGAGSITDGAKIVVLVRISIPTASIDKGREDIQMYSC